MGHEIFDATVIKKGTNAQQPSLSTNGNLIAVTLRGNKRDCGVYNIAKKEWISMEGGCEIEFAPDMKSVVRVNEGQGNGSTEILRIPIDENGYPTEKIKSTFGISDKVRLMDLPGRRSHEYFPKLDPSGTWMVWGATQFGHEHDIADYDLFIWNVNTNQKEGAVRLTFHSGNDRWPDIFLK